MLARMFSTRSDLDRSSNTFTRALVRARSTGRRLYDLTVSNPTRVGLKGDLGAVADAIASAVSHPYRPESFGTKSAREAVAREFGCAPEQVVIAASTSEAYSLLFKLLANPGDNVLTPRPSYPLLEHLIRFEALELRSYRHFYDGEWSVDLQSLAPQIDEHTRAIIAVSPNNPTGAYVHAEELEHLMEPGLPVLVDEVFWPFAVEASGPPAPATRNGNRGLVFSLGGLSKFAGLPQLKLGWIIISGDPAQVEEARGRLEFLADAYLSANGPSQEACAAIFEATRTFREDTQRRLRANLGRLRAGLEMDATLSCPKVEGGWYSCVRLPATQSSEAWALDFLDADLVVHPGHFYDFDEEGYVVLSLLTDPDTFACGTDRLVKVVAARAD